jgi:hypothetical protein
MDFREYTVVPDGNEVVIMGTIHEPVTWDFSIRVCEDDLPGIVHLSGNRKLLGLLLRAAFKRSRHGHWSRSPAEQAVEAKVRRKANLEKFTAPPHPEPEGRTASGARGGRGG